MSIEGSLPQYSNIPAQQMNVIEKYCNKVSGTLRVVDNANITLSKFAINQLIEGADLAVESNSFTKGEVHLLIMLSRAFGLKHSEHLTMNVSLSELITLKVWLETRMKHCENDRDQRNECFNPDTYIGQKLLLLDLRELMLAEFI